MSKVRFTFSILTLAILTLTITSIAQAQATRTWVSGVGDDVNPCSRTAPCKTYAGAISKTAKDGEISTLDPGGFGAVTITKSITINGGGGGQGYGSILASLVNGIIINITDAADVRKTVRLDWLNINGASTGLDGIRFIGGNALFVENTLIDGFTGDGIEASGASLAAVNQLHMRNVSIRNVANGLNISNSGANATQLSMDHVQISKATNCVNAGNGTRGQISYSAFSSCATAAINATEGTSPTEFAVNDSSITASGTGVNTGAGTEVLIARVVITGNGNALGLAGLVHTGGNNTIGKNGTNQAPNGTPFPQN
jgi:hypothetical protein